MDRIGNIVADSLPPGGQNSTDLFVVFSGIEHAVARARRRCAELFRGNRDQFDFDPCTSKDLAREIEPGGFPQVGKAASG